MSRGIHNDGTWEQLTEEQRAEADSTYKPRRAASREISKDTIDLPVPEMFASADEKVISWKGENYYRSCPHPVTSNADGSGSFCIKPEVHDPATGHEDMDGRVVNAGDPPLTSEPSVPLEERCPDCNHTWAQHDSLLAGAGKMMKPEFNPRGVEDLYECNAYAGMGNWCGCDNRSRQTRASLLEAGPRSGVPVKDV